MTDQNFSSFIDLSVFKPMIMNNQKQAEFNALYAPGEAHDKFPAALLELDVVRRLDYFFYKRVNHAKLSIATDALLQKLMDPHGSPIISVIGPTRVGKTTLRDKILQTVLESNKDLMQNDPRVLPISGIELIPARQMGFSWKTFYYQSSLALGEIAYLLSKKLPPKKTASSASTYRGTTELLYREGFISALQMRSTKNFLFDEAQNLLYLTDTLLALEELKSLANAATASFVLFGTYDLIPLRNQNAQLAFRSDEVHFPRYVVGVKQDENDFLNLLATLQNMLPLEKTPDLVSNMEDFLLGSAGCVGILKKWLYDALALTLKTKNKEMTTEIIKRASMHPDKLIAAAREIMVGESYMNEKSHDSNQYRDQLRSLFTPPPAYKLNLPTFELVSTDTGATPQREKRTSKYGVGKRKPGRDVVGKVVAP